MLHFYHCHIYLPIVRSNIVFLTTNILNPYFLHFLNIITEGFIPTYYSPIKNRMQAFAERL
ncbi:protein-export protein [Streptococcus rubneri]|uniref:Protein-export protein n=1 Tax=Streptococcus rubneri TaxID=1234680 RepID=A0A4Z1DV84_9STRE|nr:protein-export protein [Streptococcus rubneri]TGN91260.1 protein-export protein [Streptococcus rubneri]